MGCTACSTTIGEPAGCRSNGGCATGGCNKLNTFDWLTTLEIKDATEFEIVEVSFKNGARKDFFQNTLQSRATTGDMVVVETDSGHDIGQISLSGDLVRLQMKKKKIRDDFEFKSVLRKASERDLERLQQARKAEKATMVSARVIARTLGLEMKIGDVEYQGDKRKATFYYTADGRVDFRELIRHYAKEFKVKIEMRQIGARQESSRIGGLGSCGRELCCSTWLTDFKSVSTSAARYQNLAINQSKLSGQCGRLKCCLNYELDAYLDALKEFPKDGDTLYTKTGKAVLIKSDIFKRLMYYAYDSGAGRSKIYALPVKKVKEIREMNKKNEKPDALILISQDANVEEMDFDFEDVTGAVELPPEKKKSSSKRRKNTKRRGGNSRNKNKKK